MEQIDRSTDSVVRHSVKSFLLSTVLISLTFRYGQGRAPLVPQDIQTDATVGIDIGMVDTGREVNFGRFERIVGWEVYR